ncbi:hypothetical protein PHYSODRAFT_288968 [Phytophthora sojae]|uniref:RxLR effector protein n=2 Tax=Phytophthora sojae TaxID=67593 RepID=G5ABH0_PHYSP|nr:hypothetical protein PHYSODRAFT_288968 [Phytophthora sojae]AEK80555.1 Avh43 [Phytophthora sojae]AEK80556.1 Avh43 [Phytophthora sojae]EGZ06695.1 hypothetical protein PHYSODRAFT_288968 [Phytophthora sojae]|eukprot:XP_009537459.1 hypothetical protein PHYSODRAFT_288968 [Phytophthora sojae]
MRLTYFLLVAASTFLSTVDASAGGIKAELPALTSTDAAVPARAVDTSNGKRFLRAYYTDDEDEKDEDDEDEKYEEERANPDL